MINNTTLYRLTCIERCTVLSVIHGRGQKEVFIEGLRLMRSGTLFIIIASILSFIAGVLLLFVLS